jgi:hypothetical protein
MKIISFIVFTCVLFSCKQKGAVNADTNSFKFPIVVQEITKDSLVNFYAESIQYSRLMVGCKSTVKDTIKIHYLANNDSSLRNDFLQTVDKYFENDSVGTDGLEMFIDYKKNVYKPYWDNDRLHAYYPIYLFNGTKNTKSVPLKDQHAFGIQEALDSNGQWHPIEGKGSDFCGNGSWNATLKPQEFLMLLAPKYKGNYSTKLRMRIKVGPSIYVSQPYEGKINYNQFYMSKDSYFLEHIKKNEVSLFHFFYGAIPLSFEGQKLPEYAVYAF